MTDKFTNTKLTISILIISIITIFLTSEIVEKQTEDNQTEENQIKHFTKKFEDEIEPYCKGSLEATNYEQFSDIESLDINLFDQREPYLNLFNVIKDEGSFIENKYKADLAVLFLLNLKMVLPAPSIQE